MAVGRRRGRDEAASEVAATALAAADVAGPALVVDDDAGQVEALLGDRGIALQRWRRHWRPGVQASAWPPDGPFATAVVRLPKGREALEMTLHAVAARLRPDGRAWLVGANDEGIKAAPKRAEAVFSEVVTVDTRRHCRLFEMTGPREARGALDDWAVTCEGEIDGRQRTWVSFPGLFAHGRLDPGTAQLLAALPEVKPGDRVLDFACGAGIVAMAIAARQPDAALDLLDIDALALEAARRNVPGAARRIGSDGWAGVPADASYDLIVSNPPLHAGKGADQRALTELMTRSPAQLTRDGRLLLVTQKTVALREPLTAAFRQVRIVRDAAGYRVWEARR